MMLGKQPNSHSQTSTFAKNAALHRRLEMGSVARATPHHLQAAFAQNISLRRFSGRVFCNSRCISTSPSTYTPLSRLPHPPHLSLTSPAQVPLGSGAGFRPIAVLPYLSLSQSRRAAPAGCPPLPSLSLPPPPRSRSHAADVTTSAHRSLKIVRLRLRHSDGSDPGRDTELWLLMGRRSFSNYPKPCLWRYHVNWVGCFAWLACRVAYKMSQRQPDECGMSSASVNRLDSKELQQGVFLSITVPKLDFTK